MATSDVAVGDRLDNFGQVWNVLKISRNGKIITCAREATDSSNKFVLVDRREFHPRDLATFRKLAATGHKHGLACITRAGDVICGKG